jgi:PAS domain S-box-containing protein
MSQNSLLETCQSILESIGEGIIFADQKDRLTYINQTAATIRGIKAENFLGRSIHSIHSPKSSERIGNLLQGLRDGTLTQSRRVIEVRGRYFENTYYPVRQTDGSYFGTLLVSRDVTEKEQLQAENQSLKQCTGSRCCGLEGFVSVSPAMLPVFQLRGAASPMDTTVLITGERGAGKELIASAIHRNSKRGNRQMIAVNCAALPENLVESELFGYDRGAFTGAVSSHRGKFEQADGGTIFLDEVADLPLSAQAKLLRVLQEKAVVRLGSEKQIKIDVRIIAATNRDLPAMVASGSIREDLFYRLNVISIRIPPLRERREDILPLSEFFVSKFATSMGKKIQGICEGTRSLLLAHDYPGNVRELENAIEHAVALSQGDCIAPQDIPDSFVAARSDGQQPVFPHHFADGESMSLSRSRGDYERQIILDALSRTEGRKAEAAKLLNISRKTLWEKLKQIQET